MIREAVCYQETFGDGKCKWCSIVWPLCTDCLGLIGRNAGVAFFPTHTCPPEVFVTSFE